MTRWPMAIHPCRTGPTLSTRSGATLKDTRVRAGQPSEKAAPIYRCSDDDRQQEVAAGLDATVRKARQEVRQAAAVPERHESGTRRMIAKHSKKARVNGPGPSLWSG